MIGAKEIGLVLTDFTAIFSHFEDVDTKTAIHEMNGGPCAIVASLCAYVARTKFNLSGVVIRSNSVHIWIGLDNKDFDTIYPEGYPTSVAKAWDLKARGISDKMSEDPAGEEPNKCYWDWGWVNMYKAMCERWGIPVPDYLASYIAGAERMTTSSETKERKKVMEGRYLAALKIPVAKSVKKTGLTPIDLG